MVGRKLSLIKDLKRDACGVTVIEAMVILCVILICATGTLSLFTFALQTAGMTSHITAATYIAKSQIEAMKSTKFEEITRRFPPDVPSPVTGTSLPDDATWMVTYPDGTAGDLLTITVTVSWPQNAETKSVQLTTQMTSL